MPIPGGLGEAKEATAEIQKLCDAVSSLLPGF